MKIEYISQTVLRRSILKPLQTRRKEALFLPSEAEMCSAFQIETTNPIVFTNASVSGNAKEIGIYAIAKAVNNLATRGADAIGVSVQITLPPHAYESRLKAMVEHMEELCEKLDIQITCAEAEVSPAVSQAIVYVTAMGQVTENVQQARNAKPDQDIVLAGYIGLEGMLRVTAEKEEELKERFVGTFIRQIKECKSELLAVEAIKIARETCVDAMQQIGKGGILGTLWEVCEAANLGLSVSLPAMTIKQETIEVCEFYHLNPYQITSTGAVLMFTEDGKELVRRMEERGVRAAIIGRTTSGKERTITGGAEIRYMDRPGPDELNTIWK